MRKVRFSCIRAMTNIFFSKAPTGVKAGTGVIVFSDVGLVEAHTLSPISPAVDKGSPESSQPWVE